MGKDLSPKTILSMPHPEPKPCKKFRRMIACALDAQPAADEWPRPSRPVPRSSNDDGSGVALVWVIVNVDEPSVDRKVPNVSNGAFNTDVTLQEELLCSETDPARVLDAPLGWSICTTEIGSDIQHGDVQKLPVSLSLRRLVMFVGPVPVMIAGTSNEKLDVSVSPPEEAVVLNVYTTPAEAGRGAAKTPSTTKVTNPIAKRSGP